MTRVVEKHTLSGPEGRIEALLQRPQGEPRGAAVVCHPHPLYGGTMNNNVVYHTARALTELGYTTLRFNFRGVGDSEGTHAHGVGEEADLLAALDWLRESTGEERPVVAGFSFGARVALAVGCRPGAARALVALGVAPRLFDLSFVARCAVPKLFIQGERDELSALDDVRAFFDEAAPPKELVVVEGADHFFTGRLARIREAIAGWEPLRVGDRTP